MHKYQSAPEAFDIASPDVQSRYSFRLQQVIKPVENKFSYVVYLLFD